MRLLALILSFLLSLHGGDREYLCQDNPARHGNSVATAVQTEDVTGDFGRAKVLFLFSAQTGAMPGLGQNLPVSVRTTGSPAGNHLPARPASWVDKSGKSLCVNHFKSFLDSSHLAESGFFSSLRYLFSIRNLRL